MYSAYHLIPFRLRIFYREFDDQPGSKTLCNKYNLFTYRNIAIQIMNVREYNFISKHQLGVQDNGVRFVIRE